MEGANRISCHLISIILTNYLYFIRMSTLPTSIHVYWGGLMFMEDK